MINPYLYERRYSQMLLQEAPGMTKERYMEGWDRTNSLVNMLIGVSNEVARIAISDGIDALKKAGLYKQKTKQLCNETFRRQEAYETKHNSNFGDRLKLWLDYLDDVEEEYRPHIFNIYMSLKQVLDRHKQRLSEVKARLECGRICAMAAVAQFDTLMKDMKQKYGADYTPHFQAGRYDGPLHTWTQLCDIYVKTDDPKDYINLNDDNNCQMAFDILCRKLNSEEVLNRIGKKAIEMNLEVASKYASESDLKELGVK